MSEIIKYSGSEIRRRDEHMCLTDMWRACGGDKAKRPAEWLRSAEARTFTGFLSDVGISHISTVERGAGVGGGATWAHWQLAFAYAKYLSPAFHAWCNEVVRQHIEGPPVSADPELLARLDAQSVTLTMALRRLADMERGMTLLSAKAAHDAMVHTNRGEAVALRNLIVQAAAACSTEQRRVTFKAMEGVIRVKDADERGEGWNVPGYLSLHRSVVPIVREMLVEYIDGRRHFMPAKARRRTLILPRVRRTRPAKGQQVLFPRRVTPSA